MNAFEVSSERSSSTDVRVSLAIPVYNEAEVIDELLARTTAVLDLLPGGPHEIVLVDDGSRDATFSMLDAAAQNDSRIVVLSLSRNFGHQSALSAAMDFVRGDVVVVMDADLQDPPETIPAMLAEYFRGHDVVYAIRVKRKEGWLLRLCYATFYKMMSSLADLHLPEGAGDFALLSRRVVDHIRQSPERHRYLRGLRTWYGFPQIGIEVERSARHAGTSKYNIRRLFGLAFDGIFAFSVIPIRLATLLGLFGVLCSMLFAMYSLFAKFFYANTMGQSPTGFTALIFAVVFLGSIQLLFLGVVGEYIGRIYDEVKRRPHYVVARVIGRESEDTLGC